jgi:heat shock protein HtpX
MSSGRRLRFPPDAGLSARMMVTMLLLGLLYVVFIGVLASLGIPVAFVIVIAGGLFFAQYYFSDRIVLLTMGAREVTSAQEPRLHTLVERLCALADMRKPRIAVADSDLPNALATGRSPNAAVVCVTTGIMRRLNDHELEGVLAHELSHVAHRDVAIMTIASFLGVLAGFITRFVLYAGLFGGFGPEGDGNRNQGNVELAVLLVSALVYLVSFLLTAALSRYRELSADRSAAVLTGRPSELASALVKVSGEIARVPARDLRAAQPLNALFFTPARAEGFSLSSLFATHPSLQKRLDQLARIEAELARSA